MQSTAVYFMLTLNKSPFQSVTWIHRLVPRLNVTLNDLQMEYRLEKGDLVTFNNRRILHARNGFDLNGGGRHLKVMTSISKSQC